LRTREKLRDTSEVRINKTTVQATSNATSRRLVAVAFRAPDIRGEPDCRTNWGSARRERRDGKTPKVIAVRSESPNAKSKTGQPTCISSNRGRFAGATATERRTPAKATNTQASPPIRETTRLSLSDARKRRLGPPQVQHGVRFHGHEPLTESIANSPDSHKRSGAHLKRLPAATTMPYSRCPSLHLTAVQQ